MSIRGIGTFGLPGYDGELGNASGEYSRNTQHVEQAGDAVVDVLGAVVGVEADDRVAGGLAQRRGGGTRRFDDQVDAIDQLIDYARPSAGTAQPLAKMRTCRVALPGVKR